MSVKNGVKNIWAEEDGFTAQINARRVIIVYWCHKTWTVVPLEVEFLGLFFVILVDYKL
jgi:hypothetical protein